MADSEPGSGTLMAAVQQLAPDVGDPGGVRCSRRGSIVLLSPTAPGRCGSTAVRFALSLESIRTSDRVGASP